MAKFDVLKLFRELRNFRESRPLILKERLGSVPVYRWLSSERAKSHCRSERRARRRAASPCLRAGRDAR